MTNIILKDRPCGWGKTTEMIATLNPNNKYVIVVPLLSETERVELAAAKRGIEFHRPGFHFGEEVSGNKGDHARKLILAGKNIVCTHELFYRLGSVAAMKVPSGLSMNSPLADYNLIIDEVLDPFDQFRGVSPFDFRRDYIGLGLVECGSNNQVSPTKEWDERMAAKSQTFNTKLYEAAKSGSLYFENGTMLIAAIPLELLTKPKLVTVLTFLCEGSFFVHYIRKLQNEGHDIDLTIDKLSAEELSEWRKDVFQSLTIESISSLEAFSMNYGSQTRNQTVKKKKDEGKKVGNALSNHRTRVMGKEVPLSNVLLTCVRSNWFENVRGEKPKSSHWSKSSKIFGHPKKTIDDQWTTSGVNWAANTTRGTNQYIDCDHALYLYDQFPNPQIVNFLGVSKSAPRFQDAYALTELVQWLFRCQIRQGGYGLNPEGEAVFRGARLATTVYIPSARMRNLLLNWLQRGVIDASKG